MNLMEFFCYGPLVGFCHIDDERVASIGGRYFVSETVFNCFKNR